jgi:ABC-2 type transport system permease protein/oleandomycin transport system permease protein
MTATAPTAPAPVEPRIGRGPIWVIRDTIVVMRRNLLKYVRVPTLLVFSTVQPIMFVLLFAFVFGGAIEIPGIEYINFLMAGIFVQTSVFGSTNTGIGLAEDMNKGLIDRFRSLPMSRSSVLAGRTLSDSVRNIFVVSLMVIVGYLIGFSFTQGFAKATLSIVLVVTFGYAFTWISATIGLAIKDVESVQAASFIWLFPLTFASSAFVPVETMPSWLAWFARNNPVTQVVNGARYLIVGEPYGFPADVVRGFGWAIVLLVIFIPLAVNRYRRAV